MSTHAQFGSLSRALACDCQCETSACKASATAWASRYAGLKASIVLALGIAAMSCGLARHAIDAFTALTWGVVKNPGDPVTFQTVEEAVPGQAERSWQRFELV